MMRTNPRNSKHVPSLPAQASGAGRGGWLPFFVLPYYFQISMFSIFPISVRCSIPSGRVQQVSTLPLSRFSNLWLTRSSHKWSFTHAVHQKGHMREWRCDQRLQHSVACCRPFYNSFCLYHRLRLSHDCFEISATAYTRKISIYRKTLWHWSFSSNRICSPSSRGIHFPWGSMPARFLDFRLSVHARSNCVGGHLFTGPHRDDLFSG